MSRLLVRSLVRAAAVGSLAACVSRTPTDATPRVVTLASVAGVRVERGHGVLRVTNGTASPLAYAVVEQYYFEHALALFGACPHLDACMVQPGATAVIPYDAIYEYHAGATSAVLMWWRVVPDPVHGPQIVDPQRVVVQL